MPTSSILRGLRRETRPGFTAADLFSAYAVNRSHSVRRLQAARLADRIEVIKRTTGAQR